MTDALPPLIRRRDRYEVPRHMTSPRLSSRSIRVALVGCGGTGSHVATGLSRIQASLRKLAEENESLGKSLEVTVFDPDRVSEFNVGRQLFGPCDLGRPKASVIVQRINYAMGTRWKAVEDSFSHKEYSANGGFDILISCVDTVKARREIHDTVFDRKYSYQSPAYWIDCGNSLHSGQVIVGEPRREPDELGHSVHKIPKSEKLFWAHSGKLYGPKTYRELKSCPGLRLPCVTEVFPEFLREDYPEDLLPSCSMVEALSRQSLFVNQEIATIAETLLWDLLFLGGIDKSGASTDLRTFKRRGHNLRVWPLKPEGYDLKNKPIIPERWLL